MTRRSLLYNVAYVLLIVIPLCCGLAVVGAALWYSLRVSPATTARPVATERPPTTTRPSRAILPSSSSTAAATVAQSTSTPPISQILTPRPPTTAAPSPTAPPSPTRTPIPTTPAVIQNPTATQLPTVQSAPTQARFTSSPTIPIATITLSPTPTSTLAQTACIAIAWVDDEQPSQNQDVTVFGRLTCNEQPVAGAPMQTTWNFKTTKSSCGDDTDTDGLASCTRTISDATVGYTVTIDVAITWQDQMYVDHTGFTPQ